MNRIIGVILLAFGLTACASIPANEDSGLAAPAPVDLVVLERKTTCITPGTDDGIGGTGCKVNEVN